MTEFEIAFRENLTGSAAFAPYRIEPCVTSTNTLLKEAAQAGAQAPFVLIAHAQTAGRGRLGRSFFSPDGTGLYLSILLRPTWDAQRVTFLTCAAAVAVAQAIEAVSGQTAGIKWVNDIFCKKKKVCGILTEAALDAQTQGVNYAVVGIGVNLAPPKGGFPDEIASVAGAIWDTPPDRAQAATLCAQILQRFFALYDVFPSLDFLEDYRARSILLGREVTYCQGQRTLQGKVVAIDEAARLVLEDANGVRRAFDCGEISLHDFARSLCQNRDAEKTKL